MTGTNPPRPPAAVSLPEAAPPPLASHVAARAISADDVATVALLVGIARRGQPGLAPDPRAWLAMCLAARAPRDGHTCVDLTDTGDWAGDLELAQDDRPDWPADAHEWIDALRSAGPLVAAPGAAAPFILDGERLYLARSLHEEQEIARRLIGDGMDRVEILLGGPGTGKTTRVATRLIELFRDDPDARSGLALAAPTGKAAARMAEALRRRLHDPTAPDDIRNAPQDVRDAVAAVRPLTIHKLLGYRPHGTPRYAFRDGVPLPGRFVVIDEASMLSSSMMHHLLAALGENTRLLLVGDPHQLASVEAGSVLGDIAWAANKAGSRLHGRTQTLTIRHRFGPRIGALADAILAEDGSGVDRAFAILEGRWTPQPDPHNTKPDDPASIRWIEPRSKAYAGLVEEAVRQADRLRTLAKAGDVSGALAAQREFQVLCAHRTGENGVAGWNARIERGLKVGEWSPWYSGRPLMVSRNNRALDLFNGDVGIVVPGDEEGLKAAAFPQPGGAPRRVAVSQLEEVDTVHALTIHKSQGSEYGHAVVVLPDRASRIVTRELLYTGVTRASDTVTIVGSRAVIEAAIRKPIRRATGLGERLA